MIRSVMVTAALLAVTTASSVAHGDRPTDPQIAHIAYTAGVIDIAAAEQALQKSKNKEVREFAATMKRDHTAVNEKALALVEKLKVTPENNAISESLAKAAKLKEKQLTDLDGAEFDTAYIENEIAFHRTVNGALKDTLIPATHNEELKSLLEAGLSLFGEHQKHAEHLRGSVK